MRAGALTFAPLGDFSNSRSESPCCKAAGTQCPPGWGRRSQGTDPAACRWGGLCPPRAPTPGVAPARADNFTVKKMKRSPWCALSLA